MIHSIAGTQTASPKPNRAWFAGTSSSVIVRAHQTSAFAAREQAEGIPAVTGLQ